MSFFGRVTPRKGSLPAAASWAGKLSDSIGDDTIPYGQWFDTVCAHFGWTEINTNLLPNGSATLDATDWYGEFLPAGASIARSTARSYPGATDNASILVTGPTTPGLHYFNVGGAAPTPLTATMAANAITSVAGTGGGGYIGPTITVSGGTPSTPATFAVAVNASGVVVAVKPLTAGVGYSGAPTIALSGGTGATLTPVMAGSAPNQTVASVTVTAGGTGYPPSPFCSVATNAGGTGGVVIPYVDATGGLQGAFVSAGGSGYTSTPTLTVTTYRPQSRAYETAPHTLGNRYQFGIRLFVPTGSVAVANISLAVVSLDANGNATNLATATASGAQNAWLTVSTGAYTVPLTSVAIYYRILCTSTAAGQTFNVDACQIVPVPTGVTAAFPPTYTDYTERGAVGGATIAAIAGQTNTVSALLAPTNVPGSGYSLIAGTGGGISAFASTVASRVAKHTAMNILFVAGGVNDVAYGSAAFAGNANTAANVSSALDTILTAVAAMTPAPLVVILGIGAFGTAFMNATPPSGYLGYHDFAAAIERAIIAKAQQYGAIYVPLRHRITPEYIQLNGPHPTVPQGQELMAEAVIAALEQGA